MDQMTEEGRDCEICLNGSEETFRITKCQHLFHFSYLLDWLRIDTKLSVIKAKLWGTSAC
jgi:hypothetical protein